MSRNVDEAIAAFAAGKLVIVTDDDDRECEGDLICAASLCTPEKMAFIIRHSCGIVCAPLSHDIAKRLNLPPMVANNDAPLATAFTVSVDAAHGLTTGISADERCQTVRALANNNMGAEDFVRPGHVFPLIARAGGVLMRSGHTEAAVDLCISADLPPVGVICELANDDGTVMKGQQVADFAKLHELHHISVEELISWRLARERLITDEGTFETDSPIGTLTGHAYSTPFDSMTHFAFVYGDIGDGEEILTRLHRSDFSQDVLSGAREIRASLDKIAEAGAGVLIYLRDGAAGVPTSKPGRASSEVRRREQWREVGLGAQILRELGVKSIRELASHERSFVGLHGFGIEIRSTVII